MNNARLGIALMVAAMFVFGCQDALSRYLAAKYDVMTILLVRFWFFALFVAVLASRAEGGIRKVARTTIPILQTMRGIALIAQLALLVLGFTLVGLVESHAVFASYPLIVAALAGPVLGEVVTLRRWLAILAGAAGVLVILRPGTAMFTSAAMVVLLAALIFAAYTLMTRRAARHDPPETSFFYTGIVGAAAMSLVGPFFWQPLAFEDWGWMALLCVTGALGHYLLIRVFAVTEASRVQPLAYLQLIFASTMGVVVFHESVPVTTLIGAGIVVAAGLVTLTDNARPTRNLTDRS